MFAATPTVHVDQRTWTRLVLAGGFLLWALTFLLAWAASSHRLDHVLDHQSDQWGYYHYLPALLGTHEWHQLPWTVDLGNGNRLSVFSMGVAWMQAPFFLLGAAAAWLTGHPVDGYSLPFAFAQFAGAVFYLTFGCVLLAYTLRQLFDGRIAVVVPLLLFGATNLYYYSVYDTGMSHVYAFCLLAAMVHLTVRMTDRPSGGELALLVAVCGLLVLVRQLNAVALLFPLLYGGPLRQAMRLRLSWIRQYSLATALGVLVAGLFWLPQLLYWKHITGQWLVFTYGKKGEGFDWLQPHLLDVLASHQNGWFIYTPLMLLVMAVLAWHAWKGTPGARLVLVIWALVWYTYASWWCWWLGGSFGHRGFIEYYALLALPLAWGLQELFRRPRWIQEVGFVCLALLVFLNIRMSRIYQWPWEGADWTWGKLAENYLRALLG